MAESASDRVVVVDVDCQTLLYPNLMSVKQIEGVLKKRKALPPGRKLKRAQLVPLLQKWIAANRKKEKELNGNMAVVDSSIAFCRPTAVCFTSSANARDLFVGCMNGSAHCLTISSDGIQVTGTAIFSILLKRMSQYLVQLDQMGTSMFLHLAPRMEGYFPFNSAPMIAKAPIYSDRLTTTLKVAVLHTVYVFMRILACFTLQIQVPSELSRLMLKLVK